MKTTLISLVAALTIATAAIAQSAVAAIGFTDADARDYFWSTVKRGVPHSLGYPAAATKAASAMAKLPPAGQAALTTQLYAWAKTYVNSASFKSEYAKNRKELTPMMHPHKGTADDDFKAKVAQAHAEQEMSFKMLEQSGQKAMADQMRKEAAGRVDMAKSIFRREIDAHWAQDKVDYQNAVTAFERHQPADPNTLIATILREFLAASVDIDFGAKQVVVVGEGGSSLRFANAAYNSKPWQWQASYQFGPEAIAAARAAAQTWLKEIGK